MEQTNTQPQRTRGNPPVGTRWIIRRKDLPQQRSAQAYRVQPETGEAFTVTLDKRQRQVIDALRHSPIFCASPVRLSDVVHIVKRDHRLDIETLFCTDPADPDASTFGVYILRDQLTEATGCEVSA